mgnify:FL=1
MCLSGGAGETTARGEETSGRGNLAPTRLVDCPAADWRAETAPSQRLMLGHVDAGYEQTRAAKRKDYRPVGPAVACRTRRTGVADQPKQEIELASWKEINNVQADPAGPGGCLRSGKA